MRKSDWYIPLDIKILISPLIHLIYNRRYVPATMFRFPFLSPPPCPWACLYPCLCPPLAHSTHPLIWGAWPLTHHAHTFTYGACLLGHSTPLLAHHFLEPRRTHPSQWSWEALERSHQYIIDIPHSDIIICVAFCVLLWLSLFSQALSSHLFQIIIVKGKLRHVDVLFGVVG